MYRLMVYISSFLETDPNIEDIVKIVKDRNLEQVKGYVDIPSSVCIDEFSQIVDAFSRLENYNNDITTLPTKKNIVEIFFVEKNGEILFA